MNIPVVNEKIILNFGWEGPTSKNGGSSEGGLEVGVVELLFKDAKTEISVDIPENISPSRVTKLPFICRRYQETECEIQGRKFKPLQQETRPNSLTATIEQMRNLTIKAVFFEESPNKGPKIMDIHGKITQKTYDLRTDREIKLEVPEELEIGQTYSLIITSNKLSLTARLLKEEKVKTEVKVNNDEFKRRVNKMGEALVAEGIQNLHLASKGGAGVFDSSSTEADIYAHGIQGVIRAGQQMHPDIKVPHTKPSETPSDLNKLDIDELQSRFQETFIKDKKFEKQRLEAAIAKNIPEMNRITELEHANSQLLISLAIALEKKGVKPQVPQSENFQDAATQSRQAHTEALKNIEDQCKMQ